MKFNKLYEFKAGTDGILSLARNNSTLYTAGEDNWIRAFNLLNYQPLSQVKAHMKDVLCLKTSPDSKFLLSASRDGYVKQWDLNLKLQYEYEPHKSDVNTVDFLDEKTFISASDDSTLRICGCGSRKYKEINPNAGDLNAVKSVGDKIFVGGSRLIIYDKDFKEIKSDDSYIYGINLIKEKENKVFIATSMEKYLEIWDAEKFEKTKKIKFSNWINDILFWRDKIVVAHNNVISIYDKEMNIIAENDFHQDEVYSLEIFENKIITASNDSYIRIWELGD